MPPQTGKKCLIVLGMHRSGTSALSGALTIAGFNPGSKLFAPEEDNPKGNYENALITKLNEDILAELFAKWNDTLLIPDNWWTYELFTSYAGQISRILKEEINAGDAPVLIKDPRLSVLLPLYLSVLKNLDVEPSFIICIRNPYEVAASLKKRNNLSLEKSLLLWMDYQLKAEFYSRNYPRIFLSYYEFLKYPKKIFHSLKENIFPDIQLNPEIEKEVLSFLDNGLKHHNLEDQLPDHGSLPEIKTLFELLKSADLRDLSAEEIITAEKIRSKFHNTVKFYGGLSGNPEATLTIYQNDKRIILKSPVKYGTNKLSFIIDPKIPVSRLKLNPISSWVGLKILKIEASSPETGTFQINERTTNSSFNTTDGLEVFETEMPEIVIDFPSAITLNEVIFEMAYLAIGRITYRMAAVHYTDSVENLVSNLKSVNRQVENLNNALQELNMIVNNQNKELHELHLTREKQRTEINDLNQAVKDQANSIEDKIKMINDLRKDLASVSWQLDSMHHSLTWRAGRMFTAPARLIYKFKGKPG